jgi:ketosteroid isomerase-like protein
MKTLPLDGVDLVQLVDAGIDALPPEALSAFASDFEVEFVPAGLGPNPEGRGFEGFIAGWQDWLGPWKSYSIAVEEWIEVGDHVLGLARVRARTHHDDVEVEHAPAAIWTIEDGQITRVRFYLDRNEAFEAAGLDPSRRERSAS